VSAVLLHYGALLVYSYSTTLAVVVAQRLLKQVSCIIACSYMTRTDTYILLCILACIRYTCLVCSYTQQQQPLFCGMFLGGTIALAGVTVLFLGQPTAEMCLARPWFQHVALTFTLSCLLVKVRTATAILAYYCSYSTAASAIADATYKMHAHSVVL
jgi:hypothetical protein